MASTLDEAAPIEAIDFSKLNTLLAGGSGSGKTTSATTYVDPEKGELGLHLDLDNRADSIAGFDHIKTIPCFEIDPRSPRAWMKCDKIRKDLWIAVRAKKFPYQLVIVDGMTELYEVGMNWALTLDPKRGLGNSPAKHHWGPQMHNCKLWLKSILALPCRVVVTAHEDIEKDEMTGGLYYLPKATGKHRTMIPKWFSETYYCWSQQVKETQRFYWTTSGKGKRQYLKSSMNQLGRFWKDPIEVDFSKKPCGFQKLLELRQKGGKP